MRICTNPNISNSNTSYSAALPKIFIYFVLICIYLFCATNLSICLFPIDMILNLLGCNLRISYTSTKIAKRALWDEKIEKITFYQHRLYNLTGARVIMLPSGLVKRRWVAQSFHHHHHHVTYDTTDLYL